MGCDIHSYIEVRRKDWQTGEYSSWEPLVVLEVNSQWSKMPSLMNHYTGRDYELFGWLTGGTVRCLTPTHLPAPRGLPSDISAEIEREHDMMREDAHSQSYLTLPELEEAYHKIPKKVKNEMGETEKNHLRKRVRWFIDTIRVFTESCGYYSDENVRIIFWFDS